MSNVVSIAYAREMKKRKNSGEDEERRPDAIRCAFEEVIERNRQIQSRIEEERRKHIENTCRNYRLSKKKDKEQ